MICVVNLAFQEGRTIVESKTADIRHQIQRRGDQPEGQNQASYYGIKQARSPDTQIKASRDVRWQLCICVCDWIRLD